MAALTSSLCFLSWKARHSSQPESQHSRSCLRRKKWSEHNALARENENKYDNRVTERSDIAALRTEEDTEVGKSWQTIREDILRAADEMNGQARKKLGYRTPEELYEAFPGVVCAPQSAGHFLPRGYLSCTCNRRGDVIKFKDG